MKRLGEVAIYIPKGKTVRGIVLLDENQRPIGSCAIKATTPDDGDVIDLTFINEASNLSDAQVLLNDE